MGITAGEIQGGSKDFETLKNAAQQAGETTAFSATESAQALNYLALAGYDAGKAAEVLPSVLNLAAAGGMDLAAASDMVTDSMSALGIEATKSNVDEFGDKMAKTASKANTSVAQLGEATLTVGGTAKDLAGGVTELNTVLGILADNGIKGSEGGTALRNMILSLEAPTDKAAGQLEDLGVSVFDSSGEMRAMQDIMTDLNAAMADMSSAERTNVLNDIFNKVDLKSVNALLGTSTDRWNELAGAIDNSAGAMQAMADVQLDNLEGDVTLLKSSLEGLGIAAYEHIKGPMRDAVQTITEIVGDMTKAVKAGDFDDLFNGMVTAIKSIIKLVQGAGKVILKIAPKIFKVISVTADALSVVLDHTELVTGAVVALGAALALLKLDAIMPFIIPIIKTLSTGVGVLKTVGFGINGVCGALEAMGVTMTTATGVIGTLVVAIGATVAVMAVLGDGFDSSNGKLKENTDATKELCDSFYDLKDSIDQSREASEERVSTAGTETAVAERYADKLAELAKKEHKSADEKKRMKYYVDKLNGVLPDLGLEYDEERDKLNKSTDAIYKNIEARKRQAKASAYQENYNDAVKEEVKLQESREKLTEQWNKNQADVANAQREYATAVENTRKRGYDFGDEAKALGKLEQAKKNLDETSKALADNNQALEENADEQKRWGNGLDEIANEQALIDSIDAISKAAKDAGIKIPKSVQEGMQSGKYVIPQSVDELSRLIEFDSAIQKAGLQGADIPESLSQSINSGEVSVEDAIQRLQDAVKFDKMARGFGVAGDKSVKELRDGLLSGTTSVKDAMSQLTWIAAKNAKPNLKPAAKTSAKEYEEAFRARHPDMKRAGKDGAEATKSGAGSVSLKDTGSKAGQGYASGIASTAPASSAAGKKLNTSAKSGAGSVSLKDTGSTAGKGYASGIASTTPASSAAGKKLNTSAKSGAGSVSLYSTGVSLGHGLASGISSTVGSVAAAAVNLVNKAVAAARKKADINSPSKLMRREVGYPLAEGVYAGFEQSGKEAGAAAASLVESAVQGANQAVAKNGVDMSGLIASIPDAKKVIAANMSDISMRAKAAVQFEMDRRAESIPAYAAPAVPAYDDGRVLALLRDLVEETRAGKTVTLNDRILGESVNAYNRRMRTITGGNEC